MGLKDYLTTAIAAFAVGAGIIGNLPKWVGWVAIALCLVMLAISATHAVTRFRKWWNVPLWDALRIAYEKTQDSASAKRAFAMMQGHPPDVLGFYFRGLTLLHIPLYGRTPPSTRSKRIPEIELVNLRPQVGTDNLSISAAARPAYEGVTVCRRDLWRATRAIKKDAAASLFAV
jgi:hypothetical protein